MAATVNSSQLLLWGYADPYLFLELNEEVANIYIL